MHLLKAKLAEGKKLSKRHGNKSGVPQFLLRVDKGGWGRGGGVGGVADKEHYKLLKAHLVTPSKLSIIKITL